MCSRTRGALVAYLVCNILCRVLHLHAETLIVSTTHGKVQGISETAATGKEVNCWYGIPYAEKPTGALRFRPTVALKPWKNTLDATKIPPACIQTQLRTYDNFPGEEMWRPQNSLSEDCLFITIVTPNPTPKNASVMVWIHGGGFYTGSNSLSFYDHKILVSEENIIVASMQYRLGIFGFLSLDKEIDGNAGLFDQVLALKWIKSNIAEFGGNPNSITIFGESAGAGSVSHHLFSPLSKNLFSRAIMQSGTAISPWALSSEDFNRKRGLIVAKEVGCLNTTEDAKVIANCLQKADAQTIIKAQNLIPMEHLVTIPFYPVVDGKFIVAKPSDLLQNANLDKKNILLGANENEGNYFILFFKPYFNREDVTVTRGQFFEEVPALVNRSSLEIESVIFEYTDWDNVNDVKINRDVLDKIIGDQFFTCSVYDFAKYYSDSNNVFLYYYTHKNPLHHWPMWAGAMHGDEIVFVFGEPLNPHKNYTYEQIYFSKQIMRYWANFAKTGNPNCVSSNRCERTWPPFTVSNPTHVNLEVNDFSISKKAFRARQCAFWKEYLPKLS